MSPNLSRVATAYAKSLVCFFWHRLDKLLAEPKNAALPHPKRIFRPNAHSARIRRYSAAMKPIRKARCFARNPISSIRKGDSLRAQMKFTTLACGLMVCCAAVLSHCSQAQSKSGDALPTAPHSKQIHLKHVLVISETKGF